MIFRRYDVGWVSTDINEEGVGTISTDHEITGWVKRADNKYQSFTVSIIYLGDTYLEYDGHALEIKECSELLTEKEFFRVNFIEGIINKGYFNYAAYQIISEVTLYGRKFHTTRLDGHFAEVELDTDLYNLILLKLENGQLLAIDGYGSDADTSRKGNIVLRIYPAGKEQLFTKLLADRIDHYEYPRYELRHRFVD